jgi:aspartate racemase
MVLLAAFQVLLHRYSGQEDIAVGTPIANRNRVEIEGLIGFFVNTLVMRTGLGGDPSFRELLGRVREVALEAYAHQDLPFEKLVEEISPERDPSRSPLFQVMLVLQNAPEVEPKLSGLKVENVQGDRKTAKFDLTLLLTEDGGGLKGVFEYSTELFDGATIERMVGHFETLLGGIVRDPCQRISGLPILTEREERQLVEWNETEVEYPRGASIAELFEAEVERRPGAVAVVYEEQELTYGELNRRANRLGRYLKERGVGPDVAVGICMERSVEMVIGLLGILKAGGAYVPLDPEYPKDRLAFMMQDTGVRIALIRSGQLGKLPEVAEVLCLDSEWGKLNQESGENPGIGAGAENLAYVMYTSGSTGTPKGVEVVQRGVVRLVKNAGYAEMGADQTYLQLAPMSFDASTFELWAPLLNGGRCVIYPAGVPSPEELGGVIRRYGVDTLWLTASLFNVVIDEAPEVLEGVSQLLIGGEQLSTRHVMRAQEVLKGTQIINGYGPTECTTFSCCYRIPGGVKEEVLPIGKPIGNTRAYICDSNMQRVPVGIPGELYIGGDGLARGYLNRPELTADRFIPDPFSADIGARLYRTGDLARRRADGEIAFLGRMDDQVKIRGYRIELGEVEAVLGQHPGVRQAAVMAREDTPGDKRLVAYVVGKGREGVAVGALRDFLKEKLPEQMIPSAYVFLDALPLNVNGKVDRRALPVPEWSRSEAGRGYVAPQTPVEEELARIWAELLGVEKVGIYDNFFDLGGHSLLATQAVSKIRHVFKTDIPVRRIFEMPTVAGLAEMILAILGQDSLAELDETLAELETMTDDEAKKRLADKEIEEFSD